MYSEKKNVLQLVALLKAHGITHVVLSPGSRNAPLTHSFATDHDFTCYSVVDERSAGFFALGVAQATGMPVAVCCTSGSAALNLGPAVAEAFYQQLPLLAITADRPSAWIGQMDGQTIPQNNMFNDITCQSVQLPLIANDEDEWYCNRLINEAILALNDGVKGPTHINIPLDEPLFGFNQATLPPVRVIRRSQPAYAIHPDNCYDTRFAGYTKRMIIVGQLPPQHNLNELLEKLHSSDGVVVLSEQLSNIPANDYSSFDTVLASITPEELDALTPQLVITLGGHILSKRLKQFIRSANIHEHWHITPSGEVNDTFRRVTDIVKSDNRTFLEYLVATMPSSPSDAPTHTATEEDKEKKPVAASFTELWKKTCSQVTQPTVDFSDLYTVHAFMQAMPLEASLQVANSNSVRLAQLFTLPPTVDVFCNRGTNGIEGSLSTAVGYAAASQKPTFLLIGDLSFFYDMNGLWNRHITRHLRILLNNNGGGEIFGMLKGLNKSEALDDYIAAAHHTEAKHWASQLGVHYLSAPSQEEFDRQLPQLMDTNSNAPILMEVFTSMETNAAQIRAYYAAQKNIFIQPTESNK